MALNPEKLTEIHKKVLQHLLNAEEPQTIPDLKKELGYKNLELIQAVKDLSENPEQTGVTKTKKNKVSATHIPEDKRGTTEKLLRQHEGNNNWKLTQHSLKDWPALTVPKHRE